MAVGKGKDFGGALLRLDKRITLRGISYPTRRSSDLSQVSSRVISYAADAMEPSRTPDLSCASEIGGAERLARRAACAAAAVVRSCQAGVHLRSLRLASRKVAAVEGTVRKREVSCRVSLGTWLSGRVKRTVLASTL